MHYLLICDDKALPLSIEAVIKTELSNTTLESIREIGAQRIRDSGVVFTFRREKAAVDVTTMTGDPEDPSGPYDGQSWIFIDTRWSLLHHRATRKLATDIREVLLRYGAIDDAPETT